MTTREASTTLRALALVALSMLPGACATASAPDAGCFPWSTSRVCICGSEDCGPWDSGIHIDAPMPVDAGPPVCVPPLLLCGTGCVDPRSDGDYCGASGDCVGANRGQGCGGRDCVDARCAYRSCSDALAGAVGADGLYLVDADGTGPAAPHDVYCDMTTRGGGWTLVYAIANDVDVASDPWWDFVDTGAGDIFPTTPGPVPSGMHFDGPTQALRSTFARQDTSRPVEVRATLVDSGASMLLDVIPVGTTGALAAVALGTPMRPSDGCGSEFSLWIIGANSPSLFTAGDTAIECASISGGSDGVIMRSASGSVPPEPILGDTSIDRATTTTLFWIRTQPW